MSLGQVAVVLYLASALCFVLDASRVLWRDRTTMPFKWPLFMTINLLLQGIAACAYAGNRFAKGSLWFYLAITVGVLLIASGSLYAIALRRQTLHSQRGNQYQ